MDELYLTMYTEEANNHDVKQDTASPPASGAGQIEKGERMIEQTKVVRAAPPATAAAAGPGVKSQLTLDIMALEHGEAFSLITRGGEAHKKEQRKVNARMKTAKKLHPEREWVTRTLHPGDVLGTQRLKEIHLGIYRIK